MDQDWYRIKQNRCKMEPRKDLRADLSNNPKDQELRKSTFLTFLKMNSQIKRKPRLQITTNCSTMSYLLPQTCSKMWLQD
jgi:hypothetical protein